MRNIDAALVEQREFFRRLVSILERAKGARKKRREAPTPPTPKDADKDKGA